MLWTFGKAFSRNMENISYCIGCHLEKKLREHENHHFQSFLMLSLSDHCHQKTLVITKLRGHLLEMEQKVFSPDIPFRSPMIKA